MATEAKRTDEDRADDETGLDAISEAVREGHVDDVLAFLETGGNANLSSPKTGRSLLHIACRQVFVVVSWNMHSSSTFGILCCTRMMQQQFM